MPSTHSFDQLYGLSDLLLRIEDKLLERGSLTPVLGSDFSIWTSIAESFDDPNYDHCFDVIINVMSNEKLFSEEEAEEVSDVVGRMFFKLVNEELGEEIHDLLQGSLREYVVFMNKVRMY